MHPLAHHLLVFLVVVSLAPSGFATPWVIVTESESPDSLSDNVAGLKRDLEELTDEPVAVVDSASVSAEQRRQANLAFVGRWESNPLAREIAEEYGLQEPPKGGADWARRQSYSVAACSRTDDGVQVFFAMADDVSGAVNGVSHVRTHVRGVDGRLHLDGVHTSDTTPSLKVFEPSFEERAVYYNLAFEALQSQTPLNWNDEEWEYWIDKIVCCQLTHVYICLWSDHVYFPGSPDTADEDDRVRHQRLQRMIRHAHRRGLKVGYLFAPTTVPRDIFEANRDTLAATIGYVKHGFPVVCSAADGEVRMKNRTWNSSWQLMTDIWDRQLELFQEADLFQLWFYDPGGCFCGEDKHNCLGLQAQRMMQQVRHFHATARRVNPDCQFEVSLWPTWALEPDLKINYRGDFLDQFAAYANTQSGARVRVSDTVLGDGNAFPEASRRGIQGNGFIFPTNVETGCSLLTPMLAFLSDAVAQAKSHNLPSIHHMRIEEPMKFANTFTAARLYWDVATPPEEALRDYARWVANRDPEAASNIHEALLRLDQFMCLGAEHADHAALGAEIETRVAAALDSLGKEKADELEWLQTTARAAKIIGLAIDEPQRTAALSDEFSTLMRGSRTFATSTAPLHNYVAWISKGWTTENF